MKIRYFFIIAAIALGVGLVQMIMHQNHAKALVNTITTKDKSGLDATTDLAALKAYTQDHMLTGTSVFLQFSYLRAQAASQAASSPQVNGQVYAQAQAACAGKADSITQAKCVTAYVNAHSTPATNPLPAAKPNRADYTQKFDAPGWTADGTGIAFLVAASAALVGIYLLIVS